MTRDYGRVRCEFWHDHRATYLSVTAKLVAVFILTGPDGNPHVTAGRIAMRVGLSAHDAAKALDELEERDWIARDKLTIKLLYLGKFGKMAPCDRHGRPPLSVWNKLKALVFKRDNYTCRYCGGTERLECDHVQAVSRGGSNDPSNLATACHPCNRSKRDKTLEEWAGR